MHRRHRSASEIKVDNITSGYCPFTQMKINHIISVCKECFVLCVLGVDPPVPGQLVGALVVEAR